MINRNSGIRGKTRTDEEREPKNEIITSRVRDDSCLSSSLGSDAISSGSSNDSETKSTSSEEDAQPNQWTSLTVDQGEDSKTSKKEEELRLGTNEFVTGKKSYQKSEICVQLQNISSPNQINID